MDEKITLVAGEAKAYPAYIMLLKNIWRKFGYYLYFFLTFALYELMLRISSLPQFEVAGFAFSMIFNLILATFICYILTFAKEKTRVIASNTVLSLFSGLYISQIIYHTIFGTFYNTESLFNAGQILEFWQVTLRAAREKWLYILLCAAPIAIYNLAVRKTTAATIGKTLEKLTKLEAHNLKFMRRAALCVIVTTYGLMLLAFVPFARNPNTAFSMFFGQHSYEESIVRTGLLSTLQIDLLKVFIEEDMTGGLAVIEDPREPLAQNPPATGSETPAAPDPPGGGQEGRETGQATGEKTGDGTEEGNHGPIEFGYNVMEIDFDELIANERNSAVIALHEYFAYVRPTRKNQYTGMFEGYNLIKIVAEAFSPFAVHEELTPTLYKLVHEGFHFTEFYTPVWGVSTSDGEYVALTGLLPRSGVWSFSRSSGNYLPFVMGNQLSSLGYQTFAYHNHTHTYYNRHRSHPNMGYTYKAIGSGLILPQILWPNSDLEMMQATIDDYIHDPPFHAYYMTVSGHLEYNFYGNAMAARNREAVAHLELPAPLRAYIATQIELDKALEYLLDRLEEAGLAETTVIVLSSDHYPYGLVKDGFDGIRAFLGRPAERNFELHKNHLIIYAQGMESVTVDKPSSSLDIIPTISNLLGLEFDSRLMMGRDILSDSEALVIFVDRSFITDEGRFTRAGGFVPNPETAVDDDYVRFRRNAIDAMFTASARVLDLDYYRRVFQ